MIDAEIFGIDRSHSHLGFSIGFLGMSKVHGTFNDYTATILYDDAKPERSSVTLVIEAKSIDTHGEMRDRDLQGEPWFDTEKHPQIVFQSTRIERKGNEQLRRPRRPDDEGRHAALAIPMTRTVPRTPDAGWGNIRIGGTGAVTINRHDFGIDGPEFWGKALTRCGRDRDRPPRQPPELRPLDVPVEGEAVDRRGAGEDGGVERRRRGGRAVPRAARAETGRLQLRAGADRDADPPPDAAPQVLRRADAAERRRWRRIRRSPASTRAWARPTRPSATSRARSRRTRRRRRSIRGDGGQGDAAAVEVTI